MCASKNKREYEIEHDIGFYSQFKYRALREPKYEEGETEEDVPWGYFAYHHRTCIAKAEAWATVLAQYVEYKMSHYLDKAFEAMFGFVSVLPGAFCTFRWQAIDGDPLKSFFKGLDKDKHTAKEANMYLAEDRVM